MPASYTHYLIAQKTYQAYPTQVKGSISDLSLYYFGAQGADFCFFYQFYNPKLPNFGSFLHRKGGYDAFSVLLLFARRYPHILSYSLGFISHYAVDCTFHPFVYEKSGKSPVKHNRVEFSIDEHFKTTHSYAPNPPYFRESLTDHQKKELFFAYSAISAKCGYPPLQFLAFSRAISLFNAYPPITSAVFKKKEPLLPFSLLEELMQRSIEKANELTALFLFALQNKEPLPKSPFSKSYLTGK